MGNWKEITADFIIAKITGGKIRFGSVATYKTPPNAIDLADADVPPWSAVKSLSGLTAISISFAAVSTVTINWQTDSPPGFAGQTYAEVLGNLYPKPFVYNSADQKMDFGLTVNRATLGDITTDITTVVFDFTVPTTGTIQF
jgi:hypothetical protein